MQYTKIAAVVMAAAVSMSAGAAVKDGTYESRVLGHNAPFNVEVTMKAGKISNINVTHNLESPRVGKFAIEKLSADIIKHQTVEMDVVTGASVTSFALLDGVTKSLKKAGADIDSFSKEMPAVSKDPVKAEAQVVIVGGGGAGLAAAISALENGANVAIVEKLGFLGGSTNVCGGAINAAGTKYQQDLGIKDTPIQHFEQTMRGGQDTNDGVLVRHLTNNAPAALKWLEGMGLVVNPKVGAATGALFQRSHYPNPAGGHTYINVLEKELGKYIAQGRVQLFMNTKANELIVENGRVVGVIGDNKGRKVTVRATKGLIMSTGGFGSNVEFRQKVNTGIWKEANLDKEIGCSNIGVAAQGQGLIMAEKIGADLIGLADIQVHPNGTPGTGLMLDIKTSGRNRLFINTNGDRFVNEGAARDVLSKAVFAQPGQTYWLVQNVLRYPDENAIDLLSGRRMTDMLEQGRVKKVANLDELAKAIKVDPARLKASIEEYNKVARKEIPQDKFGFRATHTDDRPMVDGPWYYVKKVPTIHHTMGGIRINKNAQVLNTKGEVIPGFYAAGEVTGGIHGENRLGGNAVADCMVFGRTAGAAAAKAK